jgi:glyceraldehyde 3-phosphate dehydrogenase
MTVRVGINGFGRIGRQVLKAILETHPRELEVVAINDVAGVTTQAHLFKYDSNYGRYSGTVEVQDDRLVIDGCEIRSLSQGNPRELRWRELGVELVIEATGKFREAQLARGHLDAGAKKVLITAPAKGEDLTLVLGVNEEQYDPQRHHILSNASCTTNCLAPVAYVLYSEFGIEYGLMTTTHAYTNDQRILDLTHRT